jgi:hypothetical protein
MEEARMTIRCSQGHENPEGSIFCDQCGERLTQTSADPGGIAAAAPAASVVPGVGPKLVVQSDGTVFDIPGKSEVLIGREDPVSNIYPDVDLTEHGGEEGGVSRAHAKLYISGDQYSIEDQNSTNFTFVNRQKLAPRTPTPVHDGDEIRLGRVALTFQTA